MALYTGINGVRKTISSLYTGISGVRRKLASMCTGYSGVQRDLLVKPIVEWSDIYAGEQGYIQLYYDTAYSSSDGRVMSDYSAQKYTGSPYFFADFQSANMDEWDDMLVSVDVRYPYWKVNCSGISKLHIPLIQKGFYVHFLVAETINSSGDNSIRGIHGELSPCLKLAVPSFTRKASSVLLSSGEEAVLDVSDYSTCYVIMILDEFNMPYEWALEDGSYRVSRFTFMADASYGQ